MDILFLTALEEEAFVLEQLFRDSVGSVLNASYERIDTTFNSTQTVPCVRLTVSPSVTIQLSWMCLGGMGNVFAFGKALEAINTLSPRCVILLGLMAGRNDGTRKRGDVGYGRIIGYSSLSKIEAIPIATEIAALEKLKSHEIDVNVVIEALKQIGVDINDTLPHITYRTADLTEEWVHFTNVAEKHRKDPGSWQRLAQVSFEDLKEQFAKDNGYKQQAPFCDGTPKAFSAIVASGETVIANKSTVEQLANDIKYDNDQQKKHLRANSFDMESFGVGLCCEHLKVKYAAVKGISDFGGNEVMATSEEKDAYRLAAITSATSFTLSVVLDPTFASYLMGLPHTGWGSTACVWSKQTAPRVHGCYTTSSPSDLEVFRRHRPCTDPTLFNFEHRELLGSRVIEEVNTDSYSEQLRDLLGDTDTGMDFIFPYDIVDLLLFLQATPSLKEEFSRIKMLLSLERRVTAHTQVGDRKKLKASILDSRRSQFIEIGRAAYSNLPHFSATNECCETLIGEGHRYFEVARRFCRVMYFPFRTRKEVESDTAFLMHIYMCGPCVPTLLLTKQDHFPHDDATYIRHPRKDPHCVATSPEPVTVCMKYSEQSRLMVLVSTCDLEAPHAHGGVQIFNLSREVRDLINRCAAAPYDKTSWRQFSLFPVITLLENNGVNVKDVYLKSESRTSSRFDDYFAEMKRLEGVSAR
jgi:nucleoside phosphorylase